jgi:hypothetical protein
MLQHPPFCLFSYYEISVFVSFDPAVTAQEHHPHIDKLFISLEASYDFLLALTLLYTTHNVDSLDQTS